MFHQWDLLLDKWKEHLSTYCVAINIECHMTTIVIKKCIYVVKYQLNTSLLAPVVISLFCECIRLIRIVNITRVKHTPLISLCCLQMSTFCSGLWSHKEVVDGFTVMISNWSAGLNWLGFRRFPLVSPAHLNNNDDDDMIREEQQDKNLVGKGLRWSCRWSPSFFSIRTTCMNHRNSAITLIHVCCKGCFQFPVETGKGIWKTESLNANDKHDNVALLHVLLPCHIMSTATKKDVPLEGFLSYLLAYIKPC